MNLRYHAFFTAGKYYHVFNQSIDEELMFGIESDGGLFLEKLKKYLSDYVCIYSCVLLPTHFHLLLRCREIHAVRNILDRQRFLIKKTWEMSKTQESFLAQSDEENYHRLIEVQFLKLFTSYSMIYNHQHGRKGKLFERPFKRTRIVSEDLFAAMVHFMHMRHPTSKGKKEYLSRSRCIQGPLPSVKTSFNNYRDLSDHLSDRQMRLDFDRKRPEF